MVAGTLGSHRYQTKTHGSHHLGAQIGHKISSNYACLVWFKTVPLVILRVLLNTLQTPFKAPLELLGAPLELPWSFLRAAMTHTVLFLRWCPAFEGPLKL